MVQPCRGLNLEADIEDITSDTHGFHIKSLVLSWICGLEDLFQDLYFRRGKWLMPKEKNQNQPKLRVFLYSRESRWLVVFEETV